MPDMKRREFIALLGGGGLLLAAKVKRARAQQAAMPVVGFLDTRSQDMIGDRLNAWRRGLKETGYVEGENVTIVYRWAEGQYDRLPELAADLVRRQVAIIAAGEIERAVTEFARGLNGGLIVTGSAAAIVHRELIAMLAARHRLPAVYPGRYSVTAGGLISYGPDLIDQFRRAAGYVDRILRGEKPADLPVQAPTRYELVINLKTAKALGLEVPPTLLARADEVIE
jgi:ABC-type uncharacterized transport system substrate-binding protein